MASTASPFLHREMSPAVDEVSEYSSPNPAAIWIMTRWMPWA